MSSYFWVATVVGFSVGFGVAILVARHQKPQRTNEELADEFAQILSELAKKPRLTSGGIGNDGGMFGQSRIIKYSTDGTRCGSKIVVNATIEDPALLEAVTWRLAISINDVDMSYGEDEGSLSIVVPTVPA